MYCKYCGVQIPEDTLICPACGGILEDKIEDDSLQGLAQALGEELYTRVKAAYHKLYKLEIAQTIATLSFLVFYMLYMLDKLGTFLWAGVLLSSVAVLVIYIMQLAAYIKYKEINNYFKNAFIISIIHIIADILYFFNILGLLGNLISNILSFILVIMISKSVEEHATLINNVQLAKEAHGNVQLNTILAILLFVCTFIGISISTSYIYSIVEIVSFIKYLILLKHADERL